MWNWVTQSFIWAREFCGDDIILILNDYNNLEWPDQTQNFINIANAVQEQGGPIDAVGCQAHGLRGQSTDEMIRLLNKIHDDTGLPVYITEYDIGDSNDQAQLQKYQDHIPYWYETEWVHGITLWGWIRGATWVQDTGIVNSDNSPRPAMTWLMEYLDRPAP